MQSCTRRSEKPIQYPVDVSDSFVSQTLLSGRLSGCKAGTPVPSLTVVGTWRANTWKGPLCLQGTGLRGKCPEPGRKLGTSNPPTQPSKPPPRPQCPSPHPLSFYSMPGVVPSLWIPQAATQKEGSVIISIFQKRKQSPRGGSHSPRSTQLGSGRTRILTWIVPTPKSLLNCCISPAWASPAIPTSLLPRPPGLLPEALTTSGHNTDITNSQDFLRGHCVPHSGLPSLRGQIPVLLPLLTEG